MSKQKFINYRNFQRHKPDNVAACTKIAISSSTCYNPRWQPFSFFAFILLLNTLSPYFILHYSHRRQFSSSTTCNSMWYVSVFWYSDVATWFHDWSVSFDFLLFWLTTDLWTFCSWLIEVQKVSYLVWFTN